MIDRRSFLAGTALLATGCGASPTASEQSRASLELLRAELGQRARLGVAALDTGSGRTFQFDADSRYAMCSTFKLPLAAAILAEAEAGRLQLERRDSLRAGRPSRPCAGRARAICRGEDCRSSSSAPRSSRSATTAPPTCCSAGSAVRPRLTAFIRRSGDRVTRLDRYEEELNTNLPGDARDTTTPAAMVGLMQALLLGDVLTAPSRARLTGWMEGATTGLRRLRAGLPPGWRAGDKTGNGANGAANDIAIAWPPGRPPILIASFISGAEVDDAARHAAHAAVGRVIAGVFS